jgi:MerR family transcriptional regulator, light-induced transcriptional regulator
MRTFGKRREPASPRQIQMSGERDTDRPFQMHPGDAEAPQTLPRHAKRLDLAGQADCVSSDVRGALSLAIRNIVLPRLVAARNAHDMALATHGRSITEQDIAALLSHVTTADQHLCEAMLTVLRLRGVSRQDVLLDLFQPVAQRLGEQWLSDECSFADVTLGVSRLIRLLRSDLMPRAIPHMKPQGLRILIASMPGEQHTFGGAVADDLFRSAGWDTMQWSGQDAAMLDAVVASSPFDIIGLSICNPALLLDLSGLAARLRRTCSGRATMLIAGGHAFGNIMAEPHAHGVDAIVLDVRQAVAKAHALLDT